MTFKKILFLTHVLCITIHAAEFAPVTYFTIRSQSFNTARHISGMSSHDLLYCCGENFCGDFTVAFEYSRSFDPQSITRSLFPSVCSPDSVLRITGSQVNNRQSTDLLADYFYLPTDFSSTVCFNPVIDNFLIDFNTIFYLDNVIPGLSLALYAPLVHTRWDINMEETVLTAGSHPHSPGYFSPQSIPRGQLLANFTQYAAGENINPIVQFQDINMPNPTPLLTIVEPLRYGKISPRRLVKTRFAELRLTLNYNYFSSEDYCFGCNLHIAMPTGNRPQGDYLFESIAGNGHHAEVGGGITGFLIPYFCSENGHQVVFRYDATVTHIFPTRQKRVFDLHNQPLSRYMLVERLSPLITDNLVGNTGTTLATPSAQFKSQIAPLANITHDHVQVQAAAQADITALVTLNTVHWSWDIGYSFWARSGEQITKKGFNTLDNNHTWALKGDTYVYLFESSPPSFPAIAGSGTQSLATIHSGRNFPPTGTTDPLTIQEGQRNPGIDNKALALSNATGTPVFVPDISQPDLSFVPQQSFTSINPVFISPAQVSDCPPSQTAPSLSSKFFTHISYSFDHTWSPFCGIGGQIEFFHTLTRSSCSNLMVGPSRLNQWGVWLKVGFAYGS